ncbi:unnamed protein product [Citrullus colocynthis]|uniref:Uncharacterized protein n=1 Tax=Citrullus colocynthis TaxID=252529 RepID=A0ABP0Z9S1_9ROSI
MLSHIGETVFVGRVCRCRSSRVAHGLPKSSSEPCFVGRAHQAEDNARWVLLQLVEVEHGTKFLPRTSFLQLLSSIISNSSAESIVRSRAMVISGRLLSKENICSLVDESCKK